MFMALRCSPVAVLSLLLTCTVTSVPIELMKTSTICTNPLFSLATKVVWLKLIEIPKEYKLYKKCICLATIYLSVRSTSQVLSWLIKYLLLFPFSDHMLDLACYCIAICDQGSRFMHLYVVNQTCKIYPKQKQPGCKKCLVNQKRQLIQLYGYKWPKSLISGKAEKIL